MDPLTRIDRLLTRRAALRFLAGSALALPAGLRLDAAGAATAWCRSDPVVRVAGQEAHVYIGSSTAMLRAATDKIRLVMTVPRGVKTKLVDILADFGEGYDVQFRESETLVASAGRVPVRVAVYAPASDGGLPVVVDFAPVGTGPLAAARASGTANAWVTLTTP